MHEIMSHIAKEDDKQQGHAPMARYKVFLCRPSGNVGRIWSQASKASRTGIPVFFKQSKSPQLKCNTFNLAFGCKQGLETGSPS